MVRLSSRSFLHLLPELVEADFDQPFYARVLRVEQDEVTFRSLEGGEGTINRDVAAEHVVTSSEVNKAGRRSYLRRPVSVKLANAVHYGQVVAVDGDEVSVQSDGHLFSAPTGSTSLVAPVVALTLQHIQFNCDDWSLSELATIEKTILDRVLGREGERSSNKIPEICEGLLLEESFPAPTKMCQWIEPKSGALLRFPLHHAVDFAYYVDGGITPVPRTIGRSFCCPPASQVAQLQVGRGPSSVDDSNELFDPFQDDDDTEHEQPPALSHRLTTDGASTAKRLSEASRHGNQLQQKRRRTALDSDALIVEKLSSDPELLERFLHLRENGIRPDDADTSSSQEVVKTTSPSVAHKKPVVPSKYAFIPREDQATVHERVTSEKHKGKPVTAFVKGLVRSEHVKFKALPGVSTRIYDLRFGSGGLSIRHFARLTQGDRMAWLASGGSNFDNLSATAEFAAATPATSIEEVVDCTKVFLVFARQFCCTAMIVLAERMLEFIEQTLMQVNWSVPELPSLVYWINDLLEDFRSAAEVGDDLGAVLKRCSTDDSLLRDLMFVKVHRQFESVRAGTETPGTRNGSGKRAATQSQPPQPRDGQKRLGRIPKDVLKQLPESVDPASGRKRSLCMRFLSKAGCTNDSDGICPSDHGHFVPKTLPKAVKFEIGRRFGGLKAEHEHL
jgi:hypothetical protein